MQSDHASTGRGVPGTQTGMTQKPTADATGGSQACALTLRVIDRKLTTFIVGSEAHAVRVQSICERGSRARHSRRVVAMLIITVSSAGPLAATAPSPASRASPCRSIAASSMHLLQNNISVCTSLALSFSFIRPEACVWVWGSLWQVCGEGSPFSWGRGIPGFS